MTQIGEPAPFFALPDLEGKYHSLEDFRGQIVILYFWSADCPWVERADRELAAYAEDWGSSVALLSIASNANEPRELLTRVAAERNLPCVLHDADQRVADLYAAQATPHFFLIDKNGILRYQGAFDNVTFRQRTLTHPYLRQAVVAVVAGIEPDPAQMPPYGCALVKYND